MSILVHNSAAANTIQYQKNEQINKISQKHQQPSKSHSKFIDLIWGCGHFLLL